MKKPRNVSIKSDAPNNSRKSFNEVSWSLMFSLWCFVFLFYPRLVLGHGNGDSYIADGSNSSEDGILLKLDLSINSNHSMLRDRSADSNYSCRETNGLEEVVCNFIGYTTLTCSVQPQEELMTYKVEQEKRTERVPRPTYVDLEEFRNKTMQVKGRDVHSQLGNITHRLESGGTEYNYASSTKGAKVLAHNKEAKGAGNILGRDQDKYLRNPCSVEEKYVVIELAEETLVDAIKIANFEHYSSNFKDFELSGSLSYPTEIWTPLGNFVAANVKHAQSFMLPEPQWVRYLRLNLVTHYGSEFYCTLSLLEVYGVDAIERMLEDLIVVSEEPGPDQSLNPSLIGMPSSRSEPSSTDQDGVIQVQNAVDAASKGVDNIEDGQRLNTEVTKNAVSKTSIPDPVMEIRQQPNGRIPGDTVLKILMQKVRSLQVNLSVLEEYIKQLNQRQGDVLPELDRDISRYALLLEKAKSEIKDLMEWKMIMEKGSNELESWKSVVAFRMDALIRENSMLRLDVEKVLRDQATLENKELAVLAVSFFFVCVTILKLVSERLLMLFGAPQSEKVDRTSRGWVLILVSSALTAFIALLYN